MVLTPVDGGVQSIIRITTANHSQWKFAGHDIHHLTHLSNMAEPRQPPSSSLVWLNKLSLYHVLNFNSIHQSSISITPPRQLEGAVHARCNSLYNNTIHHFGWSHRYRHIVTVNDPQLSVFVSTAQMNDLFGNYFHLWVNQHLDIEVKLTQRDLWSWQQKKNNGMVWNCIYLPSS